MAACSVLPSAPAMGCQEACGTGLRVQDQVQDRDLRHIFSIFVYLMSSGGMESILSVVKDRI